LSYSEDENLLKRILSEIINSTAGLKNAIIIDDTGITVMSTSKFIIDEDISVEKTGAIAGAVYTAGEEQGFILGFGGIGLQITEYDKGLIFSVKIGQGVLCLTTDLKIQIGMVRGVLKKWAPKIGQILDRYLKVDQDVINQEIKDLFF